MSKSTDRERALLFRSTPTPSTRIEDGLTYGDHGSHEIIADSDESERIKRGIIDAEGETTNWKNGITYGDPRDNAPAQERERQRLAVANVHLEGEQRDRAELAFRRQSDFMAAAIEAINDAGYGSWADSEATARAAGFWQSMTPEQRALAVSSGEIEEGIADELHGTVWPSIARAAQAQNAEATRVAANAQKGLGLLRIREERGNPDDAAWNEHAKAVFARAREQGIDLADERLGSQAFEDNFRAAEVVLAEDRRAEAEANFKVDVLNATSTDINDGLTVLGPNGHMPIIPGGPVMPKPVYARAGARVLGGLGGDPAFDDADEIKRGIAAPHAPSETAEWRQTQDAAGELFSQAEKESIERKLGERL